MPRETISERGKMGGEGRKVATKTREELKERLPEKLHHEKLLEARKLEARKKRQRKGTNGRKSRIQ